MIPAKLQNLVEVANSAPKTTNQTATAKVVNKNKGDK